MALTTAQAKAALKNFSRYRTERILELASVGEPDRIHGTLLIAMASRETDLRNIVGGGYFIDEIQDDGSTKKVWIPTGEDRGLWQINDRYHARFLASVPGCPNGEFAEAFPVEKGGALPEGRVPGLTRALNYVIDLLRDGIDVARVEGVPSKDLVRVAVAGYNRGFINAVKDYKAGNVDKNTTGGNYSADVLSRQLRFRSALKELNWHTA
jgi:hypothetical protein